MNGLLSTFFYHLSRRRRTESKQLASIQLASFDREMQLTGCFKSSTSSLVRDSEKVKEL